MIFAAVLLGGCALPDKPARATLYDFGPGELSVPPPPPTGSVAADVAAAAATISAATAATAATAAAAPPLALDDIATSGGALDNQAVLYRLAYLDAQQLRPYSLARWSMPPAQLVRQRLRERLSRHRPVLNARDSVALNRSSNTRQPLLRLELDEFSQLFSAPGTSTGLIRLHATLIDRTPAGEKLVAQHTLAVQRPAPSADAAGGVRALSAATDAAIDEIDQWLQQVEALSLQ